METVRGPHRTTSLSRSAGFSLVELLIVVAILGILAAMTVPSLMGAVAHAKLRGASSSLAGLIQNGRMMAIKRNQTMTVRFVTIGAAPFAFVKEAADTSTNPASTDPQVQLGGSTFQVAVPTSANAPLLTDALLSYTPLNLPDKVSFSPRGLPCKYASGACTTAGFIYYVNDTKNEKGWAAVSVSPGGRIKQWFWNGTVWTD